MRAAVASRSATFGTALASSWLLLASWAGGGETAAGPAAPDPLAERGYAVTGGAAPGYVEDRVCASCHRDLYEAYQEVGMARSFFRPRPENLIEDLDANNHFYHEPSRRHYEMIRRDGGLVMRRYQLAADGEPIHVVEQEIDWILGSGHTSRTYLYRTPGGELYQLPVAWYTQTRSWGMAPGFDRPDHVGLHRRVRRECMFCHNAYPEVPAGSDAYAADHVYPETLPEGTGCQRCHGPGAEHARAAMRPQVDFDAVYGTIVNPGDLEPRLRDDVCYQCHMQPTVSIPGQRRFGRGTYSYRPGEPYSDYLVSLDVVDAGRDRADRFEINHHPYRLEQSPCFRASDGAMSCLTCHDPHRKVPPAERAAHYRAACLGCHEVDACRLEEMASSTAAPAADPGDCAACHMPKRRTEDVVQVAMTDHLIRRRPGGPELLAPLAERDPDVEDVVLADPARAPAGARADLYRAFAVVELAGSHSVAVAALERLVQALRPAQPEPWFALARGLRAQRRPGAAFRTLDELLARFPDHPRARSLLAMVKSEVGRREEAVADLLAVLESGHGRPETSYNLGVILAQSGRPGEAAAHLERAIELRPRMYTAWHFLGKVQVGMDRLDAAARSFRRTLELDPAASRAYLELGRVLLRQEKRAEALRVWRHGVEHARNPRAIAEALAQAGEEPGERERPASRR